MVEDVYAPPVPELVSVPELVGCALAGASSVLWCHGLSTLMLLEPEPGCADARHLLGLGHLLALSQPEAPPRWLPALRTELGVAAAYYVVVVPPAGKPLTAAFEDIQDVAAFLKQRLQDTPGQWVKVFKGEQLATQNRPIPALIDTDGVRYPLVELPGYAADEDGWLGEDAAP